MIRVGDVAPLFELPDEEGRIVRLADLRGKPVVLYFYPADFTPGCTLETQVFARKHPDFAALGAVVFGVSPQDEASHKSFAAECGAPFRLLTDRGARTLRAYGGVGLFGVHKRLTVVIGPDGRIAEAFASHMHPARHPGVALEAVRKLAGAP